MIQTTLIPTGSSAVVTEDREHGDKIDDITLREALANQREAGAARERLGDLAAVAHTNTIAELKDGRRDIEGFVTTGFTAGALASGHTNERVDDKTASVVHAVNHVGENLAGVAKDVALGFKDQQGQAYLTEGRLAVAATNNANLASVQAERIRAELGMLSGTGFQQASVDRQRIADYAAQQAERIAAAANLEAVKNTAAMVLLMTQNQAALQAQIAKCCCEREKDTAELKTEMLKLALFRVVPPIAASAGGVFPAGA